MATNEMISVWREVSPPRPGDGVCPTTLQFDEAVRASYNLWTSFGSEAQQDKNSLYVADSLLDLLQQIPSFLLHPLKAYSILDSPYPQLEYALEWVTSTDPSCDQPLKRTHHYQTLGVLEPVVCEFLDTSETSPSWPGIQVHDMRYFSYLILAWTFILSSRWVEILLDAGEAAYMKQNEEIDQNNFWELITGQQWQATIIRGKNTFYAPWYLTRHDVASHVHLSVALPDSSSAFNMLLGFCISEGISKECVASALAVVLTLPERTIPIKLPSLTAPVTVGHVQALRDEYYDNLFGCLGRCITLSCSPDGIDSLLCSTFFEPRVPCNLVGAHFLGVTKAIEPIRSDPEAFARLIVRRNSKISPLWLAVIWNGRASEILKSALGGMPPINLPVASWTGTQQSFIQVGYHPITNQAGFIPRVREYSITYLIKHGVHIPFTPSPPFGETATSNVSLDVKAHLPHNHRPIQYRTCWILETGEQLPAQDKFKNMHWHNVRLPPIDQTSHTDRLKSNHVESAADRVSSDATLNLFYWYRNNEGGMWLAENQEDIYAIRRIQAHPWIMYDSDEETFSEGKSEESDVAIDEDHIKSWRASIATSV